MRHLTRQKVLRLITAMMVFITGILLGSVLTITIVWRRIDTLADLPKVEAHQRIWRRQLDRNAESLSFDRYQQLALSLLSTTHVHQALDIQQESDVMRNGYGRYANSAGVSIRLEWFAMYT